MRRLHLLFIEDGFFKINIFYKSIENDLTKFRYNSKNIGAPDCILLSGMVLLSLHNAYLPNSFLSTFTLDVLSCVFPSMCLHVIKVYMAVLTLPLGPSRAL